MKDRTITVLLLAAAVLVTGAAPSRMRLEPPVPRLGERARLSVMGDDSLAVPIGKNVAILSTDDRGRFIAIPLQVGVAEIILPGVADTLRFMVPATLDPDSLPAPRPLHSIGILRPVWWPTVTIVAAVLFSIAILLFLHLRRRHPSAVAFPLVTEAAHKNALRRLQEIEDEKWIERGELERFYIEASRALRGYVADRYRVPALDLTRQELARRLLKAGYEREPFTELLALLESADTVKFARSKPTGEEALSWLERARDWIHDTKVELVYISPASLVAIQHMEGERA